VRLEYFTLEAMRFKPEGREFDYRLDQLINFARRSLDCSSDLVHPALTLNQLYLEIIHGE
jgi:hypothetical protein